MVRALQLQELAHPPEEAADEGPRVLQGPGENAGAVDIGDGLAAVFKIESHNHPSFIEPYQGAATGVGGIIRDIFTMGARPIALLNSLRFGPLDDAARTRRIMEGVVAGIAGYGNSIGIPTVGGEIVFEPCYAGNPLVNVFCLGIAEAARHRQGHRVGRRQSRLLRRREDRPRRHPRRDDGVGGVRRESAEKRPAVQVGDPFMEKLLLEACLELMQTDALVGIQDMGAAGLTCSTCEMGSRGGAGVEIDVAHVPQRETGMTPYEIMLSESQERMLLVVKKGREAEVERIFEKWDLHAVAHRRGHRRRPAAREGSRQGRRRDSEPRARRRSAVYDRPMPRAATTSTRRAAARSRRRSRRRRATSKTRCWRLLASPTIASKRWVYRQYDHMVRTNTIVARRAAAPASSGSRAPTARWRCRSTATAATATSIRAAARCSRSPRRRATSPAPAAVPIGATNCLNFGNPERPEIMWQLVEAVEGIAEACRALDMPITGGNVSLYNETDGRAIYPTPVIGVVGADRRRAIACVGRAFQGSGDVDRCCSARTAASSAAANT